MNEVSRFPPQLPGLAEVVEKRRDTRRIFTLRLRLKGRADSAAFRFRPGQFNMLYAFGVGEIAISIVSDPSEAGFLDHTIRIVGKVSEALCGLPVGATLGLRGPYGSAWPLEEAQGKDVVIVTGGLGCAPVISVIDYVTRRRDRYGRLMILHGLKTPRDLLYRKRFEAWKTIPNTEVYLTVDHPDEKWKYHVGVVTNLFRRVTIGSRESLVMICGPEIMMRHAVHDLLSQGIPDDRIYLSMERNMKCAVGFCGHCQFGPNFVCKDGPILRYDRIRPFFETREV